MVQILCSHYVRQQVERYERLVVHDNFTSLCDEKAQLTDINFASSILYHQLCSSNSCFESVATTN